MEKQYSLKCEIKKCDLCHKHIEKSNHLAIVNRNHYHNYCLDNLWLLLKKEERYNILDEIIQKQRRVNLIKRWLDEL